jgi:pyruvate dehydrogenase E2 component (dihydrolipoamide acetyltransferase)
MAHPILMPKPGQMTEDCLVVAWHKDVGDAVHRGDILFEIETDKSIMDVESFEEGVLLQRLVEAGETVPVNAVCAYVGTPGETVPEPADVPAEAPPPAAIPAGAPVVEPLDGTARPLRPSPMASRDAAAPATGRLAISPRASRLAAEAGLDPRSIIGTGPEGRIVERDVRAAIDAGTAVAAAPARSAARGADGEAEPVPLSRMRRIIAERLTESVTTIPHFTVTAAVDVTAMLAYREDLKLRGTALSVTDFVLVAAAQSLVELPEVNSRTDGISMWPRRRVHLGLAVSVPAGLVVPVIRDADRLSILEIHDRAAALATAARAGTLPLDDMTGSTFTVSNLGMFGVDEFSAIINPGESAILAVASAIRTPVAIGDGIAIRSLMRLTLSADHRLVDGELGARFLNAVRRRLEDPAALRREVENA